MKIKSLEKSHIGVCMSPADVSQEGTFEVKNGILEIKNWHFTPTHYSYPLILVR